MFSRKSNVYMYPTVTFNNNAITKCPHHNDLGVALDVKLDLGIRNDELGLISLLVQ